MEKNDGRVILTQTGFSGEWADWVDYDKSYAYLEGGKLYVVVYGIPDWINPTSVEEYFNSQIERYIDEEYGEFFDTEPGCPISVVVERDGKEREV